MVLIYCICLFLVLALLLNVIYTRCVWSAKNERVVELKKELNSDAQYEVVNTGSTQGMYALDYDSVDVLGLNLSLSPQLFDNDRTMLLAFRHKIKSDAKIIIPICPLSMLCDKFTNPVNNHKYYHLLRKSQILCFNHFLYFKEIIFPLFTHPIYIKEIIKYFIGQIPGSNILQIGAEAMDADAKIWINGWNKEFSVDITNNKTFKTLDDRLSNTKNQLQELIQAAKKIGNPVLVLLPISPHLSKQINKDFIDRYLYAPILGANNIGVPLLDYMNDIEFQDDALFLNSFFLNKKGANQFTLRILKDIK